MKTPSGVIDLGCGWVVAIAAVGPDHVRFLLQFDPDFQVPASGVKDLRLSVEESTEIVESLLGAIEEAVSSQVGPWQRHTALAEANDATGDLRAVQEFARHARIDTTVIYTRVAAERLARVVASIDYGRRMEAG